MRTSVRVTWTLILLAVLGLIGWDLVVAFNPTPGDTISELVYQYGQKHPWVPFGLGGVLGHFFWKRKAEEWEPTWLGFVAFGCVVAMDLLKQGTPEWEIVAKPTAFWALLGLYAGHHLWPNPAWKEKA